MTRQTIPRSKILVCAATLTELETFGLGDAVAVTGRVDSTLANRLPLFQIPEGYAAVTGVGIPLTILNVVAVINELKLRQFNPTQIINMGIAGAYAGTGWGIGEVVVGETDQFADLGMEIADEDRPREDHSGFTPLADFPFADDVHREPFKLWTPDWALGEGAAPVRRGHGATVNRCTGTDSTGAQRRAQFGVDFETMEGAAVALAGRAEGIQVTQIRAISNFAARRNMRPENIRAALDALRAFWATHRAHLTESTEGAVG